MKRNISINKKKPSIKILPLEKQNIKQLKETLSYLKLPLPGESSSFGSKAEIEKVENLIARKIAERKAKQAKKDQKKKLKLLKLVSIDQDKEINLLTT